MDATESAIGDLGAAVVAAALTGEVDIVCGQQNIASYAGRETDFPGS